MRANLRPMADLSHLLQLGQQVQGRLSQIQSELENRTVTSTVGGGAVQVVADGQGRIRSIRIDPAAVAEGDVEMLEDLLLAAVSDAQRRAAELSREELKKLTGGLPFPLPFSL